MEIGACVCTAQLEQIKRSAKTYPHPEFAQLIKCPVPVDPEARKINKITDAMLVDCEDRRTVFIKFQKWLKQWMLKSERPILLVAHNAKFDHAFLTNAAFAEFGTTQFFSEFASFSCSQWSIMDCYTKTIRQSLDSLCRAHVPGYKNKKQVHRALEDCKLLNELSAHLPDNELFFNELKMRKFN